MPLAWMVAFEDDHSHLRDDGRPNLEHAVKYLGKATTKTREILDGQEYDNFFDPACSRAQYTEDPFC